MIKKTQTILCTITFHCLLLFTTDANSTNYYIAPTSTDNLECTINNPCMTLSHTSAKLHAGDTLYVRGGTYYGQGSAWFNNVLKNFQPGTKSLPIKIKNFPGERVIFDGQESVVALFDFCSQTDQWIVIDGLEIINYLKVGLWIKAKAKGITIQNCYIHNIIEEHAVYIADYERGELGAENITIRNNIMDGGGNHASAVQCNHGSVSVSGLKIYNNIIKNYQYAGLLIGAGAEKVEIYNNTFYNNTLHTLQLDSLGDVDLSESWGDAETWVENYAADGVRNCIVKNNIIYGGPESQIAIRIGEMNMSDVISDNNIYYNLWVRMMQWGSSIYTLEEFQAQTSNDANSLVSDPLFIDLDNSNFQLKPDSPAVDVGALVPIDLDHAGKKRPQGEKFDIGAYEYPVPVSSPLPLMIPFIIRPKKTAFTAKES